MDFTNVSPQDYKLILEALSLRSADELFKDLPSSDFTSVKLLQRAHSEQEIEDYFYSLSRQNRNFKNTISFVGGGFYNRYIPAVVDEIASKGEFYTAYTPYQPEISQGTLQYIYEYQEFIQRLYAMDIANASMYDGATAFAEALLMSLRITKKGKVAVAANINPVYIFVAQTYLYAQGFEIEVVAYDDSSGRVNLEHLKRVLRDKDVACFAMQNPNFFGIIEDGAAIEKLVHSTEVLLVVSASPVSLALLEPPGRYGAQGADIVIGEGQELGNPVNFGGPALGIMATRYKFVRQMPGRIVGKTQDSIGRQAFVLTLQAREQHIKRENATSNICSNQGLNTLRAVVYLSAMGDTGLQAVAKNSYVIAHYAAQKIEREIGLRRQFSGEFLNEFVLQLAIEDTDDFYSYFAEYGVAPGIAVEIDKKPSLLLSFTEMNTKSQVDYFVELLMEYIK